MAWSEGNIVTEKNPVTPPGIDHGTVRLVALPQAPPRYQTGSYFEIFLYFREKSWHQKSRCSFDWGFQHSELWMGRGGEVCTCSTVLFIQNQRATQCTPQFASWGLKDCIAIDKPSDLVFSNFNCVNTSFDEVCVGKIDSCHPPIVIDIPFDLRSRVQRFPAWHTKAAPNGKCCEGYIVPSMVRLMYQFKCVLK